MVHIYYINENTVRVLDNSNLFKDDRLFSVESPAYKRWLNRVYRG